MNVNDIAPIALDWFKDPGLAATITAIDMAECGGDERAQGDPVSLVGDRYARYACNGYLSFGLGQVFLGVHTAMIQAMSGLQMPCELADWLRDPNNNMRAQVAIFANQGFQAWSAFNVGAHQTWLEDARAAVAALLPPSMEKFTEPEFPIAVEPALELNGTLFDNVNRPHIVKLTIDYRDK